MSAHTHKWRKLDTRSNRIDIQETRCVYCFHLKRTPLLTPAQLKEHLAKGDIQVLVYNDTRGEELDIAQDGVSMGAKGLAIVQQVDIGGDSESLVLVYSCTRLSEKQAEYVARLEV